MFCHKVGGLSVYVCVVPYAHPEEKPFEGRHIESEFENVILSSPSVELTFSSDSSRKVAAQIRLSVVL